MGIFILEEGGGGPILKGNVCCREEFGVEFQFEKCGSMSMARESTLCGWGAMSSIRNPNLYFIPTCRNPVKAQPFSTLKLEDSAGANPPIPDLEKRSVFLRWAHTSTCYCPRFPSTNCKEREEYFLVWDPAFVGCKYQFCYPKQYAKPFRPVFFFFMHWSKFE